MDGLVSIQNPGQRATMSEFYEECDSLENFVEVLCIATVAELEELSAIIHHHICHDDPCSPLWNYVNLVDVVAAGKLALAGARPNHLRGESP